MEQVVPQEAEVAQPAGSPAQDQEGHSEEDLRFLSALRELKAILAELLGEGPEGAGTTYADLRFGGKNYSYYLDPSTGGSRLQGSHGCAEKVFAQGRDFEALRWSMAALNYAEGRELEREFRRNLFATIEQVAVIATSQRRWQTAVRLSELMEQAQIEEFAADHFQVPGVAALLRAQAYSDAGIRDRAIDELRIGTSLLKGIERAKPNSLAPGVLSKLLIVTGNVHLAGGNREGLLKLVGECEDYLEAGRALKDEPLGRLHLLAGVDALERYRTGDDEEMALAARNHLLEAIGSAGLAEQGRQEAAITRLELMRLREPAGLTIEAYKDLQAQLEGKPFFPRSQLMLSCLGVHLALEEDSSLDLEVQRNGLKAAFDDMLARWREGTGRTSGTGFLWSQDRIEALATLCRAHLAGGPGGQQRALEQLLEVEQIASFARMLGAGVPSRERIDSALLGEGAGLLILLPSARGGWVVGLRAGEPSRWFPHAVSNATQDDLVEWTNLVGRSPGMLRNDAERSNRSERMAKLENGLAERLLSAEALEWIASCSALHVVDGDMLGRLSLEALPVGQGRLGLSLPLGYLPSIVTGVALAERGVSMPGGKERSLALLSATKLSLEDQAALGQGEIEFGRQQVDLLLEPFEKHRWFPHVSEGAEVFQSVREEGYTWVQVIAHGGQDLDRERSSVVLLEGGGRFGDREAEGLPVPPGIFVAACGSGLGPTRIGDPVSASLAGVLLRGGSRVVVLPVTSVPYEAGLVFMGAFNHSIADGASASLALLQARRAVAGDPRWSDPAYWAGFQAVGLALD